MAVPGLHCYPGFSLVAVSRGYSLVAVRRLLIEVAFPVADTDSRARGFGSCDSRALECNISKGLVALWHVGSAQIRD